MARNKTAISALLAVGALVAVGMWIQRISEEEEQVIDRFEAFAVRFSRVYESTQEREIRFAIYSANEDFVRKHNSENHNFELELNEFADRLPSELPLGIEQMESEGETEWLDAKNLPTEIDWRALGAVTKAKNQKSCGSCWAFSAIGAIEGAHYLQTGKLLSLSEQQLVDCAKAFGNHGCSGGKMDKAFQYVISVGGVETEEDYAYQAEKGKCKAKEKKFMAKIEGFKDVTKNNELQLKAAVARRPVSVAVQANQPSFHFYKKGVIDVNCGDKLDHGVLLVGYGEEGGIPFWLVKNSWGTHWGDHGFVKIRRDDSNADSPGVCGIASYASYAF